MCKLLTLFIRYAYIQTKNSSLKCMYLAQSCDLACVYLDIPSERVCVLRHLIFNSVFQQYVNRLSSISPSFHLPLLANQNNVDELLHSVTLHRQVSHLLISELAIGLRFLYLSVSFGIRICVLWSYFSFDIWQPCSMCVAQLLTCTWISSTESPLNLARALFPQICLNWPSVCALYNHQLRLSATSIAKQTLGKCWNGDCIANHRVYSYALIGDTVWEKSTIAPESILNRKMERFSSTTVELSCSTTRTIYIIWYPLGRIDWQSFLLLFLRARRNFDNGTPTKTDSGHYSNDRKMHGRGPGYVLGVWRIWADRVADFSCSEYHNQIRALVANSLSFFPEKVPRRSLLTRMNFSHCTRAREMRVRSVCVVIVRVDGLRF